MKKKSPAQAHNLDTRFDAGEDVLEYFDASAATRGAQRPKRGGARAGAGRKPSGRVRLSLLVSPATRRRLKSYARSHSLSLGAAVERAASTL